MLQPSSVTNKFAHYLVGFAAGAFVVGPLVARLCRGWWGDSAILIFVGSFLSIGFLLLNFALHEDLI